MRLVLLLAFRELRGGVRGLRIVLACLALGVAVIAGIGSLRVAIERGLDLDGRRILGGDVAIEGGSQQLPDALRQWLAARGATISDVVLMRSMLVAASGERQLVSLKVVDGRWPLVGASTPAPETLGLRDGTYGLAAEPIVLDRLGVRPGDTVRLGNARFTLRAPLTDEPDRAVGAAMLGARVIIPLDALPQTGLIAPGSLVEHEMRVLLPSGESADRLMTDLRAAFPDQGWRMRDARHAAPGVTRFIEQTGLFLALVGLTSLLVGGIGVATGVRAWIEARGRSIATLRCLGASGRVVFAVYLLQLLALSVSGIAAGLVIGALFPGMLAWLFAGSLPVPPRLGLYPAPLGEAALFGLLTAMCFSLWPLGRIRHISGAALFRDALLPERAYPSAAVIAVNAALAAALAALTVVTAPDRRFALWFCAAAGASLLLFRVAAAGVMAASRALSGRERGALARPWARLGLANLHRPGATTPLVLLSIGLGLSTLATVSLIQGNVRQQVLEQLPAEAPSFFFVDIQNDQLAQFEAIARRQPGVHEIDTMPTLRARVVAVNGVPADQVKATADTRWALRGDRGMTYAAVPPERTRIVAGSWWPADYDGPPLLSFDAGLASGWGLRVGDSIRVNVLGRDVDLKIANLRDIAWRSLGLNFTMVASPGLLRNAPHSTIATVRADQAGQGGLLRAVTDALPNVTGIRVEDVLHAIADLLDKLATILAATGSVTLLAGALVLAGAVGAGQRRRVQEAVILKTLGATRRQIRAAWLLEFGVLGLAAGLLASLVGTAASFGVMHFLMDSTWAFLPGHLAVTVLSCVALMLMFGYAGTASALRAKAAPLLRNQ